MPDAPENPTDDEARQAAFDKWWPTRPVNWEWAPTAAFEAGWRAAMAEVKKLPKGFGRGEVDRIRARVEERADKPRYDHSREGF